MNARRFNRDITLYESELGAALLVNQNEYTRTAGSWAVHIESDQHLGDVYSTKAQAVKAIEGRLLPLDELFDRNITDLEKALS